MLNGLGALAQGVVSGIQTGQGMENNELRNRLLGLQERNANLANLKDLLALAETAPDAIGMFKDQALPEHQDYLSGYAEKSKVRQQTADQLTFDLLQGKTSRFTPAQMEGIGRNPTIAKHMPELIKSGQLNANATTMTNFTQGFNNYLKNIEAQSGDTPVDQHRALIDYVSTLPPAEAQAFHRATTGEGKSFTSQFPLQSVKPEEMDKARRRGGIRRLFTSKDMPTDPAELIRRGKQIDPDFKLGDDLEYLFPEKINEIRAARAYAEKLAAGKGEADVQNLPVGGGFQLPGRGGEQLQIGQSPEGQRYSFGQGPALPGRTVGDQGIDMERRKAIARETPGRTALMGAQTRQANAIADAVGKDKAGDVTVKNDAILKTFLTRGVVMDEGTNTPFAIHNPADVQKMIAMVKPNAEQRRAIEKAAALATVRPNAPGDSFTKEQAEKEFTRLLQLHSQSPAHRGMTPQGEPVYTDPSDKEGLKRFIGEEMRRKGWTKDKIKKGWFGGN